MATDLITVKMSKDALRLARLIAASTGEKQYEVFDRLLSDEAQILGLKGAISMDKWREDNTEGFSKSDLEMLNRVQDRIQVEHPGVDASNIADMINNAWVDGNSEDELYAAATKRQ
jgi:hypothetical protein